MSDEIKEYHDPTQLLTDTKDNAHRALLILNQPILSKRLLKALYETCHYRICADAGGDRIVDVLLDSTADEQTDLLPTAVHGDLDSLSQKTREYFEARGVAVTRDPDQYSTDFGKCMKKIRARSVEVKGESSDSRGITDVVVLGSLSGRVDHGLGMLGEMGYEMNVGKTRAEADDESQNMTLTLVSPSAISFWLRPKPVINEIRISLEDQLVKLKASGEELSFCLTPNVGMLPLYKPAKLTTEGFEWDVEDWDTDMLGNVSTSNHFVPPDGEKVGNVKVTATEPMLFTVELNLSGQS